MSEAALVLGKSFHGVRLLHVQINQDEEYIFPHQMRKRLFRSLAKEDFQSLIKAANIAEKSLQPEEIAMINSSIEKYGGSIKVTNNCSFMLLENAEVLYTYLKEIDPKNKTMEAASANEDAVRVPDSCPAKILTGPIINIEVKEFEEKLHLHVLFESGYYFLLNQVRRLVFSHINKYVFLGLVKKHKVKVFTLQEPECVRINQFMELQRGLKSLQGHNRNVDCTCPLITKADASLLKALCENYLQDVPNVQQRPDATDSNLISDGQWSSYGEKLGMETTHISINDSSPRQENVQDDLANQADHVLTFESDVEGYKVVSPDPWLKPGPLAKTRDGAEGMHNSSDAEDSANEDSNNTATGDTAMSVSSQTDDESTAVANKSDVIQFVCGGSGNENPSQKRKSEDPAYISSAKKIMKKKLFAKKDKVSTGKIKLARQKSKWYIQNQAPGRNSNRQTYLQPPDLSDLELRILSESVINADDHIVTIGEASIAGRRFSYIRSDYDELYCVVTEVFRLFLGHEHGYDYQKRKKWQKRCQYEEYKISPIQYTAMINAKKRIFRGSKLMSVSALQKVLTKYRVRIAISILGQRKANTGSSKNCNKRLAEVVGVLLPYVEKEGKKWFLFKDVQKVLASTAMLRNKSIEIFKDCNFLPCEDEDLSLLDSKPYGEESSDDVEMLVEMQDVYRTLKAWYNESASSQDEDLVLPEIRNEENLQLRDQEPKDANVRTDGSAMSDALRNQIVTCTMSLTRSEPSGMYQSKLVCNPSTDIHISPKHRQKAEELDDDGKGSNELSPTMVHPTLNFIRVDKPPPLLLHCGTASMQDSSSSSSSSIQGETTSSGCDTAAKSGGELLTVKNDKSAFQTADFLLIPKTYLKCEDSRGIFIERASEKKLNITYVGKQSVRCAENPVPSGTSSNTCSQPGVKTFPASMDTSTNVVYSNETRRGVPSGQTTPCLAELGRRSVVAAGVGPGSEGQHIDDTLIDPAQHKLQNGNRKDDMLPQNRDVLAGECEAKLMSYVSLFVQSQTMMRESMSGLLQLSGDMQRELCHLEEELMQEKEFNDALNQQLSSLRKV